MTLTGQSVPIMVMIMMGTTLKMMEAMSTATFAAEH
jgi:hypothetical protein